MTTDWFRNATWDSSVERAFEEKLRRARRKEQYIRIQASMLASSFPEVALALLDRYFGLPNQFDQASAHVARATALLALDRVSEAIASYEAALAREAEFPRLLTQAHLDLPWLIATLGIKDQYDRALQLLQAHEARLMFPVDRFRWHAARALIAADSHEPNVASAHAERALDAARREHSGFRYHPSVGLVTKQYDWVIRKLEAHGAT